jgi:hypothetical protein
MKAYKGHTIETEPMKGSTGWGVKVNVYRNGVLVVKDLQIPPDAVTFATSDLAGNAGILIGRAWVDRELQA